MGQTANNPIRNGMQIGKIMEVLDSASMGVWRVTL